ncbi:hypothetical protein [Desulfatibacillum aliphaticivorans]|uniref:hypothetical protein n=1 Tax=Desulfatibacillum aliphaticivorans TaxID=218208 RepID=UPI0012FAB117|nr:hypothetical protein [Desulfatibacillum aliphaticivorans]
MQRRKSTKGNARSKAWQSMRILRRFTIPDLCRTSGAGLNNLQRYLRQLLIHGFVAEVGEYKGGRPGSARNYRLVRDNGPNHPVYCDKCDQPLTAKECRPKEADND